jgi:hypothetical protein
MYDVTMRDLRCRVDVACAAEARGRRRARALRRARASLERLRKTGAPWARGPAALLQAGIASVQGDRREARRALRTAARELAAADMTLHERAARARLAQLDGDPDPTRSLADLGLAEPDRWLDLLTPGRWPDADR